jgi:hypothetical protein
MHDLDMLKKGIIWHVNTETKIQIWRDLWIPRPPSFKLSLKKGRSRLRWVSQLMRTDRREWDGVLVLVRSCLYPHNADEVLKICLSERGLEDYIVWHYERSDIFSVRIPYRLALEIDQARLGGSRPMYNEIWKAKVPPKVRVFAWKLSQDGLTTQSKQKRRKVTKDAMCQLCGREDKTEFHAVVRCTKPTTLRHEMRRGTSYCQTRNNSATQAETG